MRLKIMLFVVAFGINVGLLFALPFLKYINQPTDLRSVEVDDTTLKILKVNLEPRKKKEKKLVKVKIQKPNLSREDLGNARFALDLGTGAFGSGVLLQGASTENIIYEQNQVDQEPVKISGRNVSVPVNFAQKNLEGNVELEVIIEANGKVSFIETRLEKPKGFNLAMAASSAVKTWKFRPARIKKIPVRIRVIIPFVF